MYIENNQYLEQSKEEMTSLPERAEIRVGDGNDAYIEIYEMTVEENYLTGNGKLLGILEIYTERAIVYLPTQE